MTSERQNASVNGTSNATTQNRKLDESGVWDWVELSQPLHGFSRLSFELLTSWLTFAGLFALAFATAAA